MVAKALGRRRAHTPLGDTARQVRAANAERRGERPEPVADHRPEPPPVQLGVYGRHVPDLTYQRERAYATAAALRFESRLLVALAQERTPLDAVMIPVTITVAYVEAMLVARATWPHLFPELDATDDGPDDFTEADACEMGLTIFARPPRRERRPAPNLPGCQTAGCTDLRRFGHRYCPHHEREERDRIRHG